MNTLEILTLARAKIADEKNWCQENFAKDIFNNGTPATSVTACAWCSLGALKRVAKYTNYSHAEILLSHYMDNCVAHFNDSHTHAEVLAAWDKAIALCSKENSNV